MLPRGPLPCLFLLVLQAVVWVPWNTPPTASFSAIAGTETVKPVLCTVVFWCDTEFSSLPGFACIVCRFQVVSACTEFGNDSSLSCFPLFCSAWELSRGATTTVVWLKTRWTSSELCVQKVRTVRVFFVSLLRLQGCLVEFLLGTRRTVGLLGF